MKNLIRRSSLHAKLSALMVLTSSLALLLAGCGFFGYEFYEHRKAATRELFSLADVVGTSSTAALSYGDRQAAAEALAALRGEQNIELSAIFDKDNRIFACFPKRDRLAPHLNIKFREDGIQFGRDDMQVFHAVVLNGERIGTIYLRAGTSEVYGRLWRYAGIVCVLLLLSLIFAHLVSARFRSLISGPIVDLVDVARTVSRDRNYSLRAIKHADDEIGLLIESFNEMLSQIELREAAQRVAEESLKESEERYALAARGANDGLWDWKLTTGEVYYSPRWKRMLGCGNAEVGNSPKDWFDRIHPTDRERVQREIESHCAGNTTEFVSEHRIRHKLNGYIWVLTRGIGVHDASGRTVRVAGSQTDITEGKVADALTGCPNRLYFLDRLETLLETQRTARNYCFSILFLDLDRFKLVNDSLGHSAGDQLLIGLAQRLRDSVRCMEITGRPERSATVARFGGDEFAILLSDLDTQSDAIKVASRILKDLEDPFHIEGRQVFASVSIGVAMSGSANSAEDLLRNADTAMYQAKAKGKGRYEVFDTEMRERATERMQLESDLRRAVERREFDLVYQPRVFLPSGRLSGFEALIRWKHPDRGWISPAQFIPIAEDTDLIIPIGRYVIDEACRQFAAWISRTPSLASLSVSVNVSFKQLTGSDLPIEIKEILEVTGLAPHNLRLELTESLLMGNADSTLNTLATFRDMGLGLEIDDFGTGYSSLNHLHKLPFDTVKIDQSFIQGLGAEQGSLEIVNTILELARSLHMDVVAEGIETATQLDLLKTLGCSHGQGYYFHRPLNPRAAEEVLVLDCAISNSACVDEAGVSPATCV